MRAIEKEMINAIQNRKSWHQSNTEVILCSDGTTIKVELFGNVIAIIDLDQQTIVLSDAGWRSSTTKSRLNAICHNFGLPMLGQKKYEWYQGSQPWQGSLTWNLNSRTLL